jgi:hypothetical protein
MAKMGGAGSGKSAFGRSRAAGPIKASHAQRGSDHAYISHQLEFTNHEHLRKAVQHVPDHNAEHGILPTTVAPESPFGRARGLNRVASHDADGMMPHGDGPESPLHPAHSDHRVRRAGVCQPGTRCVRELQPVLHVTCASCKCAVQCPQAWVWEQALTRTNCRSGPHKRRAAYSALGKARIASRGPQGAPAQDCPGARAEPRQILPRRARAGLACGAIWGHPGAADAAQILKSTLNSVLYITNILGH